MKPTDAKQAKKWACDTRTIRRWRKDGAPLANQKAMPTWLAGRKSLPPGTAALVASRTARALGRAATADASEATTGAPAALRRLESAESATYRVLQVALKSGNPSAVKAARETWLAITTVLRRFDAQVERGLRDSDELIPRGEAERCVGSFMYWLRLAARQAANTMISNLSAHTDLVGAFETLKAQLWENLISALAAMASSPCKAGLPPWWLKAACGSLDDAFTATEATVASRRESLEQIFAGLVRENAQVRLEKLTGLPTAPQ